ANWRSNGSIWLGRRILSRVRARSIFPRSTSTQGHSMHGRTIWAITFRPFAGRHDKRQGRFRSNFKQPSIRVSGTCAVQFTCPNRVHLVSPRVFRYPLGPLGTLFKCRLSTFLWISRLFLWRPRPCFSIHMFSKTAFFVEKSLFQRRYGIRTLLVKCSS